MVVQVMDGLMQPVLRIPAGLRGQGVVDVRGPALLFEGRQNRLLLGSRLPEPLHDLAPAAQLTALGVPPGPCWVSVRFGSGAAVPVWPAVFRRLAAQLPCAGETGFTEYETALFSEREIGAT